MLKKCMLILFGIVALLTVSQASLQVSGNTSGIPILSVGNSAYPNALVVSTNGNVGIGTTAPSTKLDVAGTVSASALQVNGTVTANSFVGSGAGLTGLAVYVTTTNADARYVSWNGTVGNVSINGTISANTLVAGSGGIFGGSAGSIFVSSNGNVGVGTTAPSTKLDVAGGINGTGLVINGNNTAVVGVNPSSTYAAYTNYGGSNPNLLQIGSENGSGGYIATNSSPYSGVISTSAAYPLHFAANGAVKMTVSSAGNVGIGITAPSTKLDVAGTVSASALVVNGTANAMVYLTNGADFAEYFDAENTWRAIPGDIVGIDALTGLARQYQPGDAFVGIVSARPGYVGNHQSSGGNQVLVGLVGQLDYNPAQTVSRQGRLYTQDGQLIGVLLRSGKVLTR